nr:MFS transporter [Parachlamydiaceae bacterium]
VAFCFKDSYVPKETTDLSLVQGIVNIRKAFFSKDLRYVFSCVLFACVGWSFYWEFTPVTWILEYGFDSTAIGRCYAYGAIVYALSCGVLIRPIVSRFSNQHVLFYALIGCSISIGMLLVHSDVFWLWVYIPLQQFGIALFWPTAAATVSNASSEDQQGEALGIFHSVESLAFAISPLIAGPLLGLGAAMPIVIGSSTILLGAGILGFSLGFSRDAQIMARTRLS